MRILLLTLLQLMLLPTARAVPELRLNNVFYTVTGDTVEALWADVLARTPVAKNGKKHVAYTRWEVNWRFWWQDNGENCDINKVNTQLDVTYTLPRLESAATTPENVAERWNRYYAALFEHEQGHKDLGLQAAQEIEQQISNMGARTDCAMLERDANRIARDVIENYIHIEKEYDRTTNHGLNNGVVFP
jgi:predicted secreted Zn-dependent protease